MKRYYIAEFKGAVKMCEHPAGAYVDAADALALERKVAELEAQLADARAQCATWQDVHRNAQFVYRDIGTSLGVDMPRELVNEVARRRMRQLQVAREALQAIAKSYPETDEVEVMASVAKIALEDIDKC